MPTLERWRCDCGMTLDVWTRPRDSAILTESTDPSSRWRCGRYSWEHLHGGEWRGTKRGY